MSPIPGKEYEGLEKKAQIAGDALIQLNLSLEDLKKDKVNVFP